jgi:hypothetical protein
MRQAAHSAVDEGAAELDWWKPQAGEPSWRRTVDGIQSLLPTSADAAVLRQSPHPALPMSAVFPLQLPDQPAALRQ